MNFPVVNQLQSAPFHAGSISGQKVGKWSMTQVYVSFYQFIAFLQSYLRKGFPVQPASCQFPHDEQQQKDYLRRQQNLLRFIFMCKVGSLTYRSAGVLWMACFNDLYNFEFIECLELLQGMQADGLLFDDPVLEESVFPQPQPGPYLANFSTRVQAAVQAKIFLEKALILKLHR